VRRLPSPAALGGEEGGEGALGARSEGLRGRQGGGLPCNGWSSAARRHAAHGGMQLGGTCFPNAQVKAMQIGAVKVQGLTCVRAQADVDALARLRTTNLFPGATNMARVVPLP